MSTNENASANYLLSFLERNGLGQLIDVPARIEDGTENTLDLLITNSSELVLDVRCEVTMVSDHEWVTVSLGSDFSPAKLSDPSVLRPFGLAGLISAKQISAVSILILTILTGTVYFWNSKTTSLISLSEFYVIFVIYVFL